MVRVTKLRALTFLLASLRTLTCNIREVNNQHSGEYVAITMAISLRQRELDASYVFFLGGGWVMSFSTLIKGWVNYFWAKRKGWVIRFLSTAFPNAPAHSLPPRRYFLTSPLKGKNKAGSARGSFVGKTFCKQKEPPNSTCLISSHGALGLYAPTLKTFSSPEAVLLLVSTKNRDLWLGPTTFRLWMDL